MVMLFHTATTMMAFTSSSRIFGSGRIICGFQLLPHHKRLKLHILLLLPQYGLLPLVCRSTGSDDANFALLFYF
jgi:hypothetical protein